MKKLKPKDRINLNGGYDISPPWLRENKKGYKATILKFIEYPCEGREGDGLSAIVIEFDKHLYFKWMRSKYGLLITRYGGQEWGPNGVVHVHLVKRPLSNINEMTKWSSRWMESHASYELIENTR